MGQIGWRVLVNLTRKSGITADTVVNTFTYFSDTAGLAEAEAVADLSGEFYNINSDTSQPWYWMSPAISRSQGAHKIDVFRLMAETDLLGAPAFSKAYSLPSIAGATPMPAECAIVCTQHADLTEVPEHGPNDTRPAARRRGRLYFGPLAISAQDKITDTEESCVKAATKTALATAMKYVCDTAYAAGTPLAVFSKTDHVLRAVTGGWVNDNFDTQRRRGEESRARAVWARETA